ncbi:MAG: radical SAM protein [Methanomassiliicoccaceae archaeon]|nr:radical SAM protein [Methanomassiliicoccaceae archaeon]
MNEDIKVALIDGYIDDPAALGVPPYISPMVRSIAGASIDAGASVEYISIDMIRRGKKMPDADVSVVLSGNTVPGKYLRSMPMSTKELGSLVPHLKGWKLIGGSAASSEAAAGFDFAMKKDIAASLYDGMIGKEVDERLRTLDEWNRWMLLGAEIVTQHQDFPHPLIAEVETYRGCHRYRSGGCSYCVEPLKGKPLMRSPKDIIAEAEKLVSCGIRNIRVGGQTCIISYGSADTSEVPVPDPGAVRELFTGLRDLDLNVLHVDNANPAVISSYPDESRDIIRTIAECCTSGNVLALGLESADPAVFRENNLNCKAEQFMDAVRIINEIGSERGPTGLPKLLPGVNLICGLDGETERTYELDIELLREVLGAGFLVRRINIRQVMQLRKDFTTKVNRREFKRFKDTVREEVDQEMLRRVVPRGTVLTDVYMELHDGNTTFGRQVGTYPILVGIPYKVELGTSHDVTITDWGYRSVTGITTPFDINSMPMSAIEGLPGIGSKRAAKIVMRRPYRSVEELKEVIDDPAVFEGLRSMISISR